jgi:PPM family protein phosphatase
MSSNSFCPTFRIEVAQMSDLGMRRMNNQDSVAVVVVQDAATWSSRGHLLMVADGMGAHAAGELASKLAVDNIPHTYFKLPELYPPAALRQAIKEANQLIFSKGQSSIGFQGMGTTCSVLVLLPQGALVAHVGDSRVYRLSGKRLSQLTFDHSLVWEMAAAGHMNEEDVPAFIPKNVITRSLGPHEAVNIDVEGPYTAATGDVFLLCSDGLSGQICDAELGALLGCLPPEEAVQTLVDLANLRGGPDNISVVVARVVGNEAPVTKPAKLTDSTADTKVGHESAGAASILLPTIAVIALFALAFSLVNEYWIAAAISAAVMAVFGGLWMKRGDGGHKAACAPAQSIGGPYGNGPYRETVCEPTRKVVDSLEEVVAKLRNLPENDRVVLDRGPLEKHANSGKAAADAGNLCTAIVQYSEAIRDTMRQLRRHGATQTWDDDTGPGMT